MQKKKMFFLLLSLVMMVLLAGGLIAGCAPKEPAGVAEPAGEGNGAEPEPAPAQKVTLKYANFPPANTFPGVQMDEWVKRAEERCGGQLEIEKFHGSTLLSTTNMFDGVLEGVADIGLSCPSYEPGRFALIELVDMPTFCPNSKVASMVLYDLVEEFQPESMKDFKMITMFTTEPAYIQSATKVARLEDLHGLELRTAGTGVAVLKALGGNPVGMPQQEVGEALQTGVIDGYVSSRETLFDFKYAEKCKYITDYPTFYISFAVLMNRNVWDSLPANIQAVIEELGPEMAYWTGEYHDGHCLESVDWAIKEEGAQIVPLSEEEKARWDEKLLPLVDNLVNELEAQGLPGRAFLDRLYELRDKYIKEFS